MRRRNAYSGFILFLFLVLSVVIIIPHFEKVKQEDPFSELVENIRTHKIKFKISEAKKVGTAPEWLKSDITQLTQYLDYKENLINPHSQGKIKIVLETLGYAGKDALSATSTVMDFARNNIGTPLFLPSLLTLIRIHPDNQSIEEFIATTRIPIQDSSSELFELFSARFNGCKNKKEGIDQEILSLPYEDYERKNTLDFKTLDPSISLLLEKSCLYGCLEERTRQFIIDKLKNSYNVHFTTMLIDVIADQMFETDTESIQQVVSILSDLMQFSDSYTIREHSFLALRRIGTDSAFNIIRSYGHKLMQTDTTKVNVPDDPFIQWAKEYHKKRK